MESNLPFITGLASISQTVPDHHETSPCSSTQQSWAVFTVQCSVDSTVQCSLCSSVRTVQCSAVQCSADCTVQCNVCSAVWTVQCSAVWTVPSAVHCCEASTAAGGGTKTVLAAEDAVSSGHFGPGGKEGTERRGLAWVGEHWQREFWQRC